MADLEDIIAAMGDAQGIDPTLADMGANFLSTQELMGVATASRVNRSRVIPVVPPPGANVGAPPQQVAPFDVGMAMSNMDMTVLRNLSTEVSSLTKSVGQILSFIQRDNQRVNTSIQNLADLQAQTQANISRQQISLTQAQVYQPEMFPYAPNLAYQTDPRAAAFRSQLQGGQRWAQRPQSSFINDMMIINPALRGTYEPSFAESPYQSIVSASRRNEERLSYIASGAGEIGSAVAGSLAGQGVVTAVGKKLAMSALAKIGLGTALGGPLGFGLGVLDVGLDLFGLPSLSGAMRKGASAIWDATGGQYFTTRDMGKDITRMTSFYTLPDADIMSGQGLGRGMAARVAGGLNTMASQSSFLDREDFMNIFRVSSEQGLLNQAGSDEQMLKSIRTISKNLRLFMRISGDPDYTSAIKQMGDLFRMGVPLDQLRGAAMNIQNFSRMAGISQEQAQIFGQQGALISQQAGANMGVGYQMGVMNRAMVRQMVQSGGINPSVLAGLGGEEGTAQQLNEIMGAFMGGPGKVLGAGLLKAQDGRAVLDMDAVKQFVGGNLTFDQLQRRASRFGQNKTAMQDYLTRTPEILNEISEVAGVAGPALMITKVIQSIMRRKPELGYQGAASVLLGREGGYLWTKSMTPENLNRLAEADERQKAKQRRDEDISYDVENQLYNSVTRTAKSAYNRYISRPLAELNERREMKAAYEESLEVGLPTYTPEVEMYRRADSEFINRATKSDVKQFIQSRIKDSDLKKSLFVGLGMDDKEVEAYLTEFSIGKNLSDSYIKDQSEKYQGLLGGVDEGDLVNMRTDFDKEMSTQYGDKWNKLDRNTKNILFDRHVNEVVKQAQKSPATEVQDWGRRMQGAYGKRRADEFKKVHEKLQSGGFLEWAADLFGLGLRGEEDVLARIVSVQKSASKDKAFGSLFKNKTPEARMRLTEKLLRVGLGEASKEEVLELSKQISTLDEKELATIRSELKLGKDASVDDIIQNLGIRASYMAGDQVARDQLKDVLDEYSSEKIIGTIKEQAVKAGAEKELIKTQTEGRGIESEFRVLSRELDKMLPTSEMAKQFDRIPGRDKQDTMIAVLTNISTGISQLVKHFGGELGSVPTLNKSEGTRGTVDKKVKLDSKANNTENWINSRMVGI